jgi:hypothetical protein
MTKFKLRALLPFVLLCLAVTQAGAQTGNLLQNPKADLETRHWLAFGQAAVEEVGGNRVFVIRDGGYLLQDIVLPGGAVGKFAVLIGRGSSERINPDGAITGLPYLYGYMMAPGGPEGGRIFAYLQGQEMLCSATSAGEWVKMWGVFRVPEGTGRIRFFLNQALRRGVPHNGSAARFDDLGLYLFPTEEEAESFAASYQ